MIETILRRSKHFVENPAFMLKKFLCRYASSAVPDKWYIEDLFFQKMGYHLDLKHPKTFNEKLQWLKLYDRNPLYTKLVDKVAVKEWVADKIGAEYIIPTLGVYSSFDEIDFSELPNQFVLKCSHDSGSVVICRDKATFDVNRAKEILNRGLSTSFYSFFREWPYKNVKPRILVEEYLSSEESGHARDLNDYKFFCFDGEPQLLFVASERNNPNVETRFDFFDIDFKHLPFKNGHPNAEITPKKPAHYDELVKIARKLSAGMAHVRVDLYVVGEKVYFGEMTFYHWSGFVPFDPVEWDHKIGEMLTLPKKR